MIRLFLLLCSIATLLAGCGKTGSKALPIPADAAIVVRANMAELNKNVSEKQLLELATAVGGSDDMLQEMQAKKGLGPLFSAFWAGKEIKGLNFALWYGYGHNIGMPDQLIGLVVPVTDAKAVRKDLVKSLGLPKQLKFEEEDDLWVMNLTEGSLKGWVLLNDYYLAVIINPRTGGEKEPDATTLKDRAKAWMVLDEDENVQQHEAFRAMEQRKGLLVSYISFGAVLNSITAAQPMAAVFMSALPFSKLYSVTELTAQPGRLLLRYDFFPTEANATFRTMFVAPNSAHSGYLPAHSTVMGLRLNLSLTNIRGWVEDLLDKQGGMFKQGYEKTKPNILKFEKIFSGRFYFAMLDMATDPTKQMLYVAQAELNQKGALERELIPWLDKLGLQPEELEPNAYRVKMGGTDYYLTEERGLLLVSNHTDIRSRLARYNPEGDKTLAEQKALASYPAYYYVNLNHRYLPRGLRDTNADSSSYSVMLEKLGAQRLAGYVTTSGAQYFDLSYQQKDKNGLLKMLESLVLLHTEREKGRSFLKGDQQIEEAESVSAAPL